MSRVWLITGTSTGFGRGLTALALAKGDQVIATARNVSQIQDFAECYPDHALALPLDVTQTGAEAVVAQGIARFGQIDVLVNNAGYGYFATQEQGDLGQVQQMFEVNVLGLIRTTQAVVPQMRTQGSGTIVNLSSIAGRIAFAAGGFYNASKFAVEALSESLFYEVSPFGIRVILIEPGAFATDFSSRSAVRDPALGAEGSPYQQAGPLWMAAIGQLMPHRQDPQVVIEALWQVVTQPGAPFLRVPLGEDALQAIALREQMGDQEFIKMMAQRYGITWNGSSNGA